MIIRFRVVGITRDRRTQALRDAYRNALDTAAILAHDEEIERLWRARVKANEERRRRARSLGATSTESALLRRQAG